MYKNETAKIYPNHETCCHECTTPHAAMQLLQKHALFPKLTLKRFDFEAPKSNFFLDMCQIVVPCLASALKCSLM
jgi:hypothetical protein